MGRLIDADALMQLAREYRNEAPKSPIRRHICEVIHWMLGDENRTPTIDAEPVRHGRWVLVKEWATKAKYRCSICGREEMSKAGEANPEKLPYCHCGAKMDGGGRDA